MTNAETVPSQSRDVSDPSGDDPIARSKGFVNINPYQRGDLFRAFAQPVKRGLFS
jgi:hypothetical protein